MYCNQGTSRYLYKQHELSCELKADGPSCIACKNEGLKHSHSPENPAHCPLNKQKLVQYIYAREKRQDEYNHKLIAEISRRILIKGGNPTEVFLARRDIRRNSNSTNAYMALMEQLKGMELITSKWDTEPIMGKPGNTLLITLINLS